MTSMPRRQGTFPNLTYSWSYVCQRAVFSANQTTFVEIRMLSLFLPIFETETGA
jgi:hypothetical protein